MSRAERVSRERLPLCVCLPGTQTSGTGQDVAQGDLQGTRVKKNHHSAIAFRDGFAANARKHISKAIIMMKANQLVIVQNIPEDANISQGELQKDFFFN